LEANALKLEKYDTVQNLETKSNYNSKYKEQHDQNKKGQGTSREKTNALMDNFPFTPCFLKGHCGSS